MGLDTNTDRLTDRRSQHDFDFDFEPITLLAVCFYANILRGLFDPEDGGDMFLRNVR
jgi:hypothetical protein